MDQNKGCFEVWYLSCWLFLPITTVLRLWEQNFLMTLAVPTSESAGIQSEEMRKWLTPHSRILCLGLKCNACTVYLTVHSFFELSLWFCYNLWKNEYLLLALDVFSCRGHTSYLCNQGVWTFLLEKSMELWVVFRHRAETVKNLKTKMNLQLLSAEDVICY